MFSPEKVLQDELLEKLTEDFIEIASTSVGNANVALPLLSLTMERLFDVASSSPSPVISLADYEASGSISRTIDIALQRARNLARLNHTGLFSDLPQEELRVVDRQNEPHDFLFEVILYHLVSVDPTTRTFVEKRLYSADVQDESALAAVVDALNDQECRLVTEKGDGPNRYFVLAHVSIVATILEGYPKSRLITELHSAVADVKYMATAWHDAGRPARLLGALPHHMEQIRQVEENAWLRDELLDDPILTDFVSAVNARLDEETDSRASLEQARTSLQEKLRKKSRQQWFERGAIIAVVTAGIGLAASALLVSVSRGQFEDGLVAVDQYLADGKVNEAILTMDGLKKLAEEDSFRLISPEQRLRLEGIRSIQQWRSTRLDGPDRVTYFDPDHIALTANVAFVSTKRGALASWSFTPESLEASPLPDLVSDPKQLIAREDGAWVAYDDLSDGVIVAGAGASGSAPRYLRGFSEAPSVFTFSEQGGLIAAASEDRQVAVWSLGSEGAEDADRIALYDRPSPRTEATALAFSRDGRYLAIGRVQGRGSQSSMPTVSLVEPNLPTDPYQFVGLTNTISTIGVDPTEQLLVAFELGGRGCLWRIRDRNDCVPLRGHEAAVTHIWFDPVAPRAISTDAQGVVVEHNLTNQSEQRKWDADVVGLVDVAITRDAKHIALLDSDGCMSVFAIASYDSAAQRICSGFGYAVAAWQESGLALFAQHPSGVLSVEMFPLLAEKDSDLQQAILVN